MRKIIILMAALVFALSACSGSATSLPGGDPKPITPNCAQSPYSVGCPIHYSSPSTTASTAPAEYSRRPEARDFSIALSVKSKQCFGSAGCNVTVEPTINYLGANTLTSGYKCDLTYSIKGDESGELVQTAYNTGGTMYNVRRTLVSTTGNSIVPTAEVTSVSCSK